MSRPAAVPSHPSAARARVALRSGPRTASNRPRSTRVPATLAVAALLVALGPAAAAQGDCLPGVTATALPSPAMQGEPVTLTVTNGTPGTIVLPSSCLWQAVFAEACGGPVVQVPYCLDILTFLDPGASKTAVWDQRDGEGNQVPPGTYVFSVPNLCCVAFTVEGPCDDPPFKYGPTDAGSSGHEPRIDTAGGMPQVGNAGFRVTVDFALGGAPALLLVGAQPADVALGWGSLLVDPSALLLQVPLVTSGTPGVAGLGALDLPAPLPADPALIGAVLYLQVLVADPGGFTGKFAHTRGLRITLCG